MEKSQKLPQMVFENQLSQQQMGIALCLPLDYNHSQMGQSPLFKDFDAEKKQYEGVKIPIKQSSVWNQSQTQAFYIFLGKYFIQNLNSLILQDNRLEDGIFTRASQEIMTKSRVQCKTKFQSIKKNANKDFKSSSSEQNSSNIEINNVKEQIFKFIRQSDHPEAQSLVQIINLQQNYAEQFIEASLRQIKQIKKDIQEVNRLSHILDKVDANNEKPQQNLKRKKKYESKQQKNNSLSNKQKSQRKLIIKNKEQK